MYHNNPYVGPRPFEEEQASIFFGRESEAADLLSLVLSRHLILFYAPSGAGKSSLLNARLIPSLRQEELFVFPIGRVGGISSNEIKNVNNIYTYSLLLSLQKNVADPSQFRATSLAAYLQDFQELRKATHHSNNYERVLIIDQFEEIITHYPDHWG